MGLFKKLKSNINSVVNNTLGKVIKPESDLGFITKNVAYGANLITGVGFGSNIEEYGLLGGLGAQLGDGTKAIRSITGPIMGGITDPGGKKDLAAKNAELIAAGQMKSPETIASEEAARIKKSKLEEEARLLADHPGRGGVIANSAPTYRFT